MLHDPGWITGLMRQGSVNLLVDRIKQGIASCKVSHHMQAELMDSKSQSFSGRGPTLKKSTQDHSRNLSARLAMYTEEQTVKLGKANLLVCRGCAKI